MYCEGFVNIFFLKLFVVHLFLPTVTR
jgi:hypothetical protein